MEENHQDLTPFSTSPVAPNDEIRIAMSSTEENIRKLYEASKMGSIQILKKLLQDDPNLIQKAPIFTSNIESPLHLSISHGHLEFIRVLLDHNPELAAEVDTYQQTPLHLAAANGYLEIIRALLEKNTSSCLVLDQNGLIPLHYAVSSGQIEIIQELINARPQSVWMKLNNGQTILHLCVEGNHLEAIKLLTKLVANRDKDFLDTIDDVGDTILDLALTLRQIEMVGYLLSIPEVKTKTSIVNSAISNCTKEKPESQKKRSKLNSKRSQRQESASSSAKKTTRHWKVWIRKKLKYKGDWIQEVQGTMMLVATVIGTMTFQAAINPPGGVWQQDTRCNKISRFADRYVLEDFPAGTAAMACKKDIFYSIYLTAITVSFLASLSVIVLIVSRFPLKNRVCSWLLSVAMCMAVFFLGLGFLLGILMVSFSPYISLTSFIAWFAMVCLVCLWYIIYFLVSVVKSLWRTFKSKFKSCSFKFNSTSTP